ncbi:MAG TPA: helix-turn-helix domain-containing protein [Polyangiaceae bacterium]|nr:helix-turn-helix domain-containing protein [Polyangiaceae bacterium]
MSHRPGSAALTQPWGELDSLVFAGAYDVVARRAAGGFADDDAPAVVGALALAGRLDEAESVFDARVRGKPALEPRARFFLIAGLCHAGNSARALGFARQNASLLRRGSASDRFWACQGLALVRHFEGRLGRARRVARRALAAAVEADFPYGRFLSLDLLAHVEVHTGHVHAGMRLLTQASELADALGYTENAATERAAHLLFELRFALSGPNTLGAVQALVSTPDVSYFTRRNGWLELSSAFALRGCASDARLALEEARRIALTGADRRARARYFIGDALCAALARGPAAAAASLAEARTEAQGQLMLLGEILFVELSFCRERSEPLLLEADRVARATGVERTRIAAQLAWGRDAGAPVRVEDGLCRLLLELGELPPASRVHRLVVAEQLGLLPWALGVAPGRRLVALGSVLISENEGNVSQHELKNRPALRLLLELARGYRSRAELMRDVWNIGNYVPARHTATLHTAVSRLRVAFADPDWIITHDDGYSLAAGVQVLSFDDAATLGAPVPLGAPSPSLPPPDDRQRVLSHVEKHGASSSAEVAKALRLSGSTALRILRALCEEGLLERQGSGRATRYLRLRA